MSKKPLLTALFCFSIILFHSCAIFRKTVYYPANSVLPNTEAKMLVPDYWISMHPYPDKVILGPKGIKKLNSDIARQQLTNNIKDYPSTLSTSMFAPEIRRTIKSLRKSKIYFADGKRVKKAFFKKIAENIALEKVNHTTKVSFGLVTHLTNQRVLPTNDSLFAKKDNLDFDILQSNSLEIGTPVAILWKSTDTAWCYVDDPSASGWVESHDIALCGRKELRDYVERKSFVIVSKAKAGISLNSSLKDYYDFAKLGTRLPMNESKMKKTVSVEIPLRDKDGWVSFTEGFIAKAYVNVGYFPYTARNIIRRSFEMINSPYGWGCMNGEQDCSGFIQEIFATVGINMPKNSTAQSKVGILLKKFDRKAKDEDRTLVLLNKAVGGETILFFNGHIMLYLGAVENRPYVIHEIWGYNEKSSFSKQPVRVINRTAVSDLSLGEGSKKGSLLHRLSIVRLIK